MKDLVIYLHGLNSSPQSLKACLTSAYIKDQKLDVALWVPALPTLPNDISIFLKSHLEDDIGCRSIYIIGSSSGGFIGVWLHDWLLSVAGGYSVKLVLINPLVPDYGKIEDYLGLQRNFYTGEEWVLDHEYVDQIRAMEIIQLSQADSVLLIVQTGDETLDYRLAVARYAGCQMLVQEGGSHRFDNFDEVLPDIFNFFMALPLNTSG